MFHFVPIRFSKMEKAWRCAFISLFHHKSFISRRHASDDEALFMDAHKPTVVDLQASPSSCSMTLSASLH
ncbi:hypothetical protein AU509_12965 [Lonsdalea britannica]|nr:hypothetical protein AU509_12965 [Lonsdalea britannica]